MAPNLAAPVVAPMPAATDVFFPEGPRERDRLLFVGRLNAQKGIEILLRAVAMMRQRPLLDIVGDGEQRDAMRSLASSLGITDRLTWHGAQPQERLAPFYRRAAALVVPSLEEGLGLVAVEAHLCETPVIAFDSGGLRDIVQDQRTGILVPDYTPNALAEAVDALLGSFDHARKLGQAGRDSALARFSPDAVARLYEAIYREALVVGARR